MLRSIFLLTFLLSFQLKANEEPNFSKEEKFHQIYRTYNEKPTPNNVWENLLQTGGAQTYQVQQGDTLWDLSEALFGDPQYWPKIWSLNNPEVLNPHEIQPNQTVYFTEGTLGQPPKVELKDNTDLAEEKTTEEVNKENVAATEEDSGEPDGFVPEEEIPPPQVVTPHKKLPPSFPDWLPSKGKVSTYILDLKPFEKPAPIADPIIDYYIADQVPNVLGEVVETDLQQGSAAVEQYIYVKLDAASSSVEYHVVKDLGQVKDITGAKSNGQVIQVLGEIEVMDKVNSSGNIYRAKVTRNVDQVYKGGKLVAGPAPVAVTSESVGPSVKAAIIGGQFGLERKLYATGSIVFLNAGSAEGLVNGQTLSIFKNSTMRNKNTVIKSQERQIGNLKVIKTENQFSTAIILNSTEEIQSGDLTYQNSLTE
jgi:hypothetical protein